MGMRPVIENQPENMSWADFEDAPAPSFAIIIEDSFQGDTNGHDNDP
jgi:hypothetical protein